MLQFDVLTIFPEIIRDAVSYGLLGRACQNGLIAVHTHNLRDFSDDKHRRVDDVPYGGGPGMVLKPDPVVKGIEAATLREGRVKRIMLSPRGNVLSQEKVKAYTAENQLILVCGRYEGVDERSLAYVDEEISIGDYILAGGEFAALVIIDAVSRLVPGVVGDQASLEQESLKNGLLEYPQYTRPRVFRGMEVPEVLLTGNHGEIEKWRREESEKLTRKRRPDLVRKTEV